MCLSTDLCIVSEGFLEQSLLDLSVPHFGLYHPLCPTTALVGICCVKNEQH